MNLRVLLFTSLLLAIPLLCTTVAAAEDAGITKEQADTIVNELRHIRQTLNRMEKQQRAQAKPAKSRPKQPKTLKIAIGERPVLGDPEAPVTLVEFVDFQCPYCKRFFSNTYPELKENYIDKGKLRLVVKDMPLGFHGEAREAAQAAHCAGEQGAYWGMHDLLHTGSGKLDRERFLAHAAELKLDRAALESCLTAGRHLDHIDQDADEAQGIGVRGTPSFIVGKSDPNTIEGAYIRGALPFAVFQKEIDKLLGKGS